MKHKKLIILFFLISIFLMGLLVNANSQNRVIALLSAYNNKYVCADINVNSYGPLFANRDVVGPWEKFELIPIDNNGYYALRSIATGKYVSAEENGTRRLTADANTYNTTAEIFYLYPYGSLYVLRSMVNNRYVRFDSLVPEQDSRGMGVAFYVIDQN